jgi:hypothetical protein
MLLRRRAPQIDRRPADPAKGFEHLDARWIAILRWLNANAVDYVLVGGVAEAVRGRAHAEGPVTIVPSPYRRNFERLSRALSSERARLRVDSSAPGEADTVPVKITGEKLARGHRWTLRCGVYDLDIEATSGQPDQPDGVSRYQELLYETNRFELAAGVTVEVAAPEDIEHYEHVRRTGMAPEIQITRQSGVRQDTG